MRNWLRNRLFVVAVVLPAALGAGCGGGEPAAEPEPKKIMAAAKPATPDGQARTGRWHPADRGVLSSEDEAVVKQLEAIGYVAGSQEAPEQRDVTVHDRDAAYDGLNLYVSGHGPEAVLMDMEGRELHRWRYPFREVWPDWNFNEDNVNWQFWRRAHLFENGDLLAIFEGFGLIKVDKDSNLLWAFDGKAHHDLFVADDGRIYTLTREAVVDPKYHGGEWILDNSISILSPDGEELQRVSLLRSLENSDYAPVLKRLPEWGDIFHANTVERLDGRLAHRSPAFREGNVLVSILHLDLVGVVDMEAGSMVWMLSSLWRQQHQPTILDNGRMLVFDNLGNGGKTRILELDPLTQQIHWSYTGNPENTLHSHDCGSSAALPNGNVLITESNTGRALEVTRDKQVVWEFFNPHRAGDNDELIATLFEVVRLDPDFPVHWCQARH